MKVHIIWSIAGVVMLAMIVGGFLIATLDSDAQQTKQKLACFASHGSWSVSSTTGVDVCLLKAPTNG